MPETRSWSAGLPFSKGDNLLGRLSMSGGKLELSDRELTFSPVMKLGPKRTVAIDDILDVAPSGDHPPRLRIRTRSSDEWVLIVVDRSQQTPASGNTGARDDALAAITAARGAPAA